MKSQNETRKGRVAARPFPLLLILLLKPPLQDDG